jgi:hypothetical protein
VHDPHYTGFEEISVVRVSLGALIDQWQHQAATKPHVRHKPRLLSDNGPSYIAGELAEWIGAQGMSHARGAPFQS